MIQNVQGGWDFLETAPLYCKELESDGGVPPAVRGSVKKFVRACEEGEGGKEIENTYMNHWSIVDGCGRTVTVKLMLTLVPRLFSGALRQSLCQKRGHKGQYTNTHCGQMRWVVIVSCRRMGVHIIHIGVMASRIDTQ